MNGERDDIEIVDRAVARHRRRRLGHHPVGSPDRHSPGLKPPAFSGIRLILPRNVRTRSPDSIAISLARQRVRDA